MSENPTLTPSEGWCALHLFYRIEHAIWSILSPEERDTAKANLLALIAEIRALPSTQLITSAMVSPKSDIGFLLLTPSLADLQRLEKRLTLALGPNVLDPVYSYLSLTERSEYGTTEEEYSASLEAEKNLVSGSPEHTAAMEEFRTHQARYVKNRLYPVLPAWPVFCFYPMSKRRVPNANWFSLPFAERKRLMAGHAKVGRRWHGKILQLISGSTGLDSDEWGVTLLAHNPEDIKAIVYEMRFDPVSADYADFGDFFIGLQLPPESIFERLQL